MKPIRTSNWCLGAVALATFATVALGSCIISSSASASQPAPFFRSLDRLERALRTAVEDQPQGLLKGLAASELVCQLGEGSEGRGERDAATADWDTLAQAMTHLDEPALEGVSRTFGPAESSLDTIELRFSRAWSQEPTRAQALRAGARIARHGVRHVTAGLDELRRAFKAWGDHRCEAAVASTDNSDEAISAGVALIGRGMERLWLITTSTGLSRGR